jgi:hypothetical protein
VLAGQDPIDGIVAVPDVTVTDTDAVFAEAGVDGARVAELRDRGVIA